MKARTFLCVVLLLAACDSSDSNTTTSTETDPNPRIDVDPTPDSGTGGPSQAVSPDNVTPGGKALESQPTPSD
jgi:hypothetical protein